MSVEDSTSTTPDQAITESDRKLLLQSPPESLWVEVEVENPETGEMEKRKIPFTEEEMRVVAEGRRANSGLKADFAGGNFTTREYYFSGGAAIMYTDNFKNREHGIRSIETSSRAANKALSTTNHHLTDGGQKNIKIVEQMGANLLRVVKARLKT